MMNDGAPSPCHPPTPPPASAHVGIHFILLPVFPWLVFLAWFDFPSPYMVVALWAQRRSYPATIRLAVALKGFALFKVLLLSIGL